MNSEQHGFSCPVGCGFHSIYRDPVKTHLRSQHDFTEELLSYIEKGILFPQSGLRLQEAPARGEGRLQGSPAFSSGRNQGGNGMPHASNLNPQLGFRSTAPNSIRRPTKSCDKVVNSGPQPVRSFPLGIQSNIRVIHCNSNQFHQVLNPADPELHGVKDKLKTYQRPATRVVQTAALPQDLLDFIKEFSQAPLEHQRYACNRIIRARTYDLPASAREDILVLLVEGKLVQRALLNEHDRQGYLLSQLEAANILLEFASAGRLIPPNEPCAQSQKYGFDETDLGMGGEEVFLVSRFFLSS